VGRSFLSAAEVDVAIGALLSQRSVARQASLNWLLTFPEAGFRDISRGRLTRRRMSTRSCLVSDRRTKVCTSKSYLYLQIHSPQTLTMLLVRQAVPTLICLLKLKASRLLLMAVKNLLEVPAQVLPYVYMYISSRILLTTLLTDCCGDLLPAE